MFNRKLLLGITALGVSFTALAGNISHTPLITASGSNNGGFFIGIEGLYMQPNNNKLDYAISEPDSSLSYPSGKTVKVKPDYDLGFSIAGGYQSAGNNDVGLSYTRLHASDSGSTLASDEGELQSRLSYRVKTSQEAKAHVNFDYDAVDLVFGKQLNAGHWGLHLGAGLRYAQLDSKYKVNYIGDPKITFIKQKSDYSGLGPRFVTDGTYNLGYGFDLTASAGATVLIGKNKASHQETYYSDSSADPDYSTVKGSTNKIIPGIDVKMGVRYTHHTNLCNLSINAGWKAINYFDVRDSIRFIATGHKGAYEPIASSVSFNGPYLGLKVSAI